MDTLNTLTQPTAPPPAPTIPPSTTASVATAMATKVLALIAGALVTHGIISSSMTETFISGGLLLASVGWTLWNEYFKAIVLSQLEVLKAKSLAQAAALKAANVPKVTVDQIAAASPTMDATQVAKAIATLPPEIKATVATDVAPPGMTIPKAVITMGFIIVGLGLLLQGDAHAQTRTPVARPNLCDLDPLKLTPGCQVTPDLITAIKSQISGAPSTTPATPLPCTFQMLIKLTPANLLATINQCIADKLVSDTQRALTSAQAYGGSTKGDADAVNCLTPALAMFQAGVEVPAVPEVPAVLNPDGSVKTPDVPAVPAQEPGPILLYQKYREFTLSGALTSCQSWFNGPINATAAAGLGAASTAIGAAAVLAPIK